MAETQLPMIRVLGFKTTYENLPVKGDPLKDKCDLKGNKLDASGLRIREPTAEHWVTYSPAHSPINTQTTERVRHMIPDPAKMGDDQDGGKLRFMTARWSQIEPAYDAFLKGQSIPISGVPLAAWPGVNPEQAEVLRQHGIRSVEEVRDLAESVLDRIRLPNMRDLRNQARLFIENSATAKAAAREAQKDAIIEQMAERMAAMESLLEERTRPAKKEKAAA